MPAARPESALVPDGYEYVQVLGHGGTGSVILARQVALDRLVAIKTIHAGIHDRTGQLRLEREARAIVALRHPSIVSVYELRRTPYGAALVMEYVPGDDVGAAIRTGTLTGPQAAAVICATAEGLAHAHAAGIVHRDLKPANVLLTVDRHAKIADFGLARISWSPTAFRTSGDLVTGTPAYLAPEQILDPTRELPANDVYALSVLAYELLTGRRPYPARDVAEYVAAHLHGTAVPPWEYAPQLPAAVGAALLAGLAKNPHDRPPPQHLSSLIRQVPDPVWASVVRTRTPRAADPVGRPADTPDATMRATAAEVARPVVSGEAVTLAAGPATPVARTMRRRDGLARRLAVLAIAVAAGALAGVVIALILRSR